MRPGSRTAPLLSLIAYHSRALLLVPFLLCAGPAVSRAAPMDTAMLQGLDKVTARTSTFQARLDTPVRFGALTVTLRHCDRTPPEETPESTAYLEIVEVRPGEEPRLVFGGWMFASSPALSAMEHPVYDIWVLECTGNPLPVPEEEDGGPDQPGE